LKLYCISGLGIDQTPFEFLDINPEFELVYVKWIEPKKRETLPEYALRLAEIIDESEPFALLGLSFGGMISIEIAKVKKPVKLILLSSIPNPNQMPWFYKLGNAFRVYAWFPFEFAKQKRRLIYKVFGIKGQAHKRLMDGVMEKTDSNFLRWAIRAILTWKNDEDVHHYRIHGTNDKILPLSNCEIDFVVEKGTHFMVVIQSDKISGIINRVLS